MCHFQLSLLDPKGPANFLNALKPKQKHDIRSVMCTSQSAVLRYVIAISPDTVTVAIDADQICDSFFDRATALKYGNGYVPLHVFIFNFVSG